MSAVDIGIVLSYIVAIIFVGIFASLWRARRAGSAEGNHYFLAGSSLTWPVIGLAMFAANISTVQLVSFAQSGYCYGLVYGNFEWQAGFTLVALSLFFAPVYLRSKLPTIPEFFERRYSRRCRDILTVISLFSAIVIHIGTALFTAAYVLQGLLDLSPDVHILGLTPLLFFIIVLGLLTGIYTLCGGLLAVVWTESFQTILLLGGSIAITLVGLHMVGGWHRLVITLQNNAHPLSHFHSHSGSFDPATGHFLSIMRPRGDPSGLPWYSVLLGYQVLAVWYWCTDQTIVQRLLAARDTRNAQLGPLFCAWLKILPVLLFVLPGVICVALVQQNAFGGIEPRNTADTFTFMVTHLLPVGLKGLVIAALLAAAMQTCSAALNSTATLIAYDLVKVRKPEISDHKLVFIGRIATAGATIVAIILSPLFGHYSTIIEGMNKLISYMAPSITAVVIGGIFTRWATARAAVSTLIFGMCSGVILFLCDWFKIITPDYMLVAFVNFLFCIVVLYALSRWNQQILPESAETCIWEGWRSTRLKSKVVLPAAITVVCVFVALYARFW